MTASTEPSRGRPLAFDPDAVLDQLVLLFWRHGYDATTQTDMAKATGLSTSSLYNTFGDKATIFRAVLARYTSWAETNCQVLLDSPEPVAELARFVDRLEQHVREPLRGVPGCLMTTSMTELADREPDITAEAQRYRALFGVAFGAALRRAQAAGELTPGDAQQRAALLVSVHLGVLATARSAASTAEPLLMVQGMRDLLRSWAPSDPARRPQA